MLLVCATFPLIWVGGLVTTYEAGMAVPDWPTTYGYNLFLYPWQTWLAGPWDLFIEHGHRLFGALVGMLTILLVVTAFRLDGRIGIAGRRSAPWRLVIGQGALGGMRVLLDQRLLAQIHGCVGADILCRDRGPGRLDFATLAGWPRRWRTIRSRRVLRPAFSGWRF